MPIAAITTSLSRSIRIPELETGPYGAAWLRIQLQIEGDPVEAHDGKMPAQHSFASVDADNVVLTAMKKTEDGDALSIPFLRMGG